MNTTFSFDFSCCNPVNYLWPCLVERIGIEKAQQAVNQACDLQRMHGSQDTLPILISETCGLALVKIELLRFQTGLACHGQNMVLILSTKEKSVQLLQEI